MKSLTLKDKKIKSYTTENINISKDIYSLILHTNLSSPFKILYFIRLSENRVIKLLRIDNHTAINIDGLESKQ